MAGKISIILFVILSVNLKLLGQEIKFTDFKDTQQVEYSNFEKIEREMQRAAKERKNKIVAIYRVRFPYNEIDDKGFEIQKTKITVFLMLYTVFPFEVLNRIDFISIGNKRYAAPQGRVFPELYFSEERFKDIEDGTEVTGIYGSFGKIDKKMIDEFPIVKAKKKRAF